MALPFPINPTQTDCKSPVDENLMDSVRENLDDLDSRILGVTSFDYQFKMNGPLSALTPQYGLYKRIDVGYVVKQQTFSVSRLLCEVPGASGTLEVDLRKYRRTGTAITGIASQYLGNINSITQIAPAIATQSITRATAQISTQSVSLWKTALNVQSIIGLGRNLWRYDLNTSPDSGWAVGDSITITGCTAGANNGTFTIVRINDDGRNNIVLTNASGVAQTGVAGSIQLNAWSYNFTNPVNANFAAGEQALFASHSAGGNNGNLTIFAINQSGNNIIVKNASGVTQAGVAGTVDTFRMQFNYSSSVPSDFVVGEKARMASHSTGVNNGDHPIRAVNSGGNNLILYIVGGVTQGGAAGTANTTRYVYALASDPATSFTVGEICVISGATKHSNNGLFTVLQIDRGGTDNIVVSNATGGSNQAGAAGTLAHSKKIISFATDQSAIYTTESNIEIYTCPSSGNNGYFDVVQVNRGGGSNYNVVVDNPSGAEQASPAGRIEIESKSIYATRPSLTFPESSFSNQYNNAYLRKVDSTGAAFNSNAVMTTDDVTNGVVLGFDIRQIPSGNISDIMIQLA